MTEIIDFIQAHPITYLPIAAFAFVIFLAWKAMKD
jgi:hypothetical protein